MRLKCEIHLAKGYLLCQEKKKSHELASWLWKKLLLCFSSMCAVSLTGFTAPAAALALGRAVAAVLSPCPKDQQT